MAEQNDSLSIGDLLQDAYRRLAEKSDTAALDAQVLLANILGQSRTWIMAHPEKEPDSVQRAAFAEALIQAANGVPLPYLTGKQEFYGIEFLVNPAVLIPRPETEHLIDEALNWLKEHPDRRRALDVGTGSGCIAVTLACDCPDIRFIAMDISMAALRTARKNAARQGVVGRLRFVQSDLLSALGRRFDLICANLPYGSRANLPPRPAEGMRGEPRLAIEGGEDGLDLIRRFLIQAPACLEAGGLLLMEIEAFQGLRVEALARAAFPAAAVDVMKDLAGLDRIIHVQTNA